MPIQFRKVDARELMELAGDHGTYPGGSARDFEGFKAYIRNKGLKDKESGTEFKARDNFLFCSYRKSTNIRDAENKLLDCCDGSCPANKHQRSNLPTDTEGYVYVLHN